MARQVSEGIQVPDAAHQRTRMTFSDILDQERLRIDKDMDSVLTTHDAYPFLKTIHHYNKAFCADGGKRLRPILLRHVYAACGGKGDVSRESLCVELMHNSTLVHDDIMDEDLLRRGRATVVAMLKDHKVRHPGREQQHMGPLFNDDTSKFAISQAILAGSMLYALGARTLSASPLNASVLKRALDIYHDSYDLILEGQVMDICFEQDEVTVPQYMDMISLKTATLIRASARIGCTLAEAPVEVEDALSEYATHMAIAFQIQDDIMDFDEDGGKGRSAGRDLAQGKKTLPILLALEQASGHERAAIVSALGKHAGRDAMDSVRRLGVPQSATIAQKHVQQSLTQLARAEKTIRAQPFLRDLARYMTTRKK
ncbi:MAG: polyprenyl synthetase family protein [Nanoarchaeota archaeon]